MGSDKIIQDHYRRRQLLGILTTGDNTAKSKFNKDKWLPIAKDMPFLVSHYCCNVMKKSPLAIYQRKTKRYPYIATMTEESAMRKQAWLRNGCNAFNAKKQSSQPMSFWTEQDVLQYIRRYNIEIAPVYGDVVSKDGQMCFGDTVDCKLCTTGCDRTGCVFCGFGCHLEKGENRFQRLKRTHPNLYDYCMRGGKWIDNPQYDATLSKEPDEMGWVEWNPKQIWIPDKGLGMAKVFDMLNEVYGKDFMRYE